MKSKILLTLILVFAIFSRFHKLDSNPPALFSDEVDIGYQVKSLLSTGKDYEGHLYPLQFHSFSDVRTSLPIYTTALVSQLPKFTIDQAIRITPAIFSILAILGLYFLTNKLFELFKLLNNEKDTSPGIFAALVTTLLPWHYTYSRTGFELSMLFAFLVWGLYFYTKFLANGQLRHLIYGLVVLAFTPMIYSTAKLSIIFFPLLLGLIPGSVNRFKEKKVSLTLLILFIPMIILFLDGGAEKRFKEISIFGDPIMSTGIDYQRKVDLGPTPEVGSVPGTATKLAHNKVVFIGQRFLKNFITPFSLDFLFVKGDPNPRHAVQGWGMLQKVLVIPLLIGIYFSIRKKHDNFSVFCLLFSFIAIFSSALTQEGATHSSRNFLLIFPLILIIAYGFYEIFRFSKIITIVLLLILSFESFLYLHDYWYHYPYDSQKDWHAGLKEAVLYTNNYPDKPIIISRMYEPPLIFFLYYSNFPPQTFQKLYQDNHFLDDVDISSNLEGFRLTDTNVYFASVKDKNKVNPFKVDNALYIVTANEYQEMSKSIISVENKITLPSGDPIFYALEANKNILLTK